MLTLQVLDAFASRSHADYHYRISHLPVSKARSQSVDARGQSRSVTTYAVNGVVKLRVVDGTSGATAAVGAGTVAFDDDPPQEPCCENCDPGSGSGGDDYATQQDRDDAYTALVAIDYDVETNAAAVQADIDDFAEWWEANYGASPSTGPSADSGPSNPCVSADATFGATMVLYVAATAELCAAVLDPEPVTKTLLFWKAAATLASGVLTFTTGGDALKCHRDNGH